MTPNVYTATCGFQETVYGMGATVDASTGSIVNQGTVQGTFVAEWGGWPTHEVTSYVNAILLQEVLGYDVSFVYSSGTYSTERMSTMGRGLCTPTHLNPEVWTTSQMTTLKQHANESTMSNIGYWGRSSLGKPCMLVLNMRWAYDPGYLQAIMSNNNVPAYFCFAGDSGLQAYVVETMQNQGAITFYHYEPDMFHIDNAGKFARILWPLPDPAIVVTATGTFGELGYVRPPLYGFVISMIYRYGKNTTNPVSVDYPQENLMKIYSNILRNDDFLSHYVNKLVLTQLDVTTMMADMAKFQASSTEPANFAAACQWVRSNYDTWTSWVDNLPLCDIRHHVTYTINGCNDTIRHVSFQWTRPDPTNVSLPFVCDGGLIELPLEFHTSRSCDWLNGHEIEWTGWVTSYRQPACDGSFYSYTISACSSASTRQVTFAWLLPDAFNLGISSECSGGAPLPSNAVIDCDFVPFSSSAYVGIAVFTAVVLAVLAILTALVLWFRERPIIKRSQWPLLVLMLVGGFFLCATALLGGGAPTPWLCAGRPIAASLGYTMVFGSLLAKSLRVYLVFHQKAMKRVVITVWRALQWFLVVLGIDSCILAAWMVVDFPHPVTVTGPSTDFHGDVDTQQCSSSQFIFPALSMFWKGLVTCGGVYVAFQIRQADSDFQESAWMFASSCIVVVGGGVLLIVTYAATMPATSVFLFQAVLILLCTVAVMTLMLVPKLLKLHAVTPIEVFASRKSTASSSVRLMSSKKQLKLNSQRQSSGSLQAPTSAVRVQSSGASQDLGRDATSVASVASSL
ncbi:hypothetical protein DYB36_000324 [Aphanomyces astaci]|uniref:G-protein coupled receptors family 3 profile domain-containing protein n=3 Tax=Aphanomyces astaci TaxID=112090 RepID=A0A397BKE1_APHAT|nr:hypothetical protein DYB36_000324 [Aphanomyces astaci]